MQRQIQQVIIPIIAVAASALVLWYSNQPAPAATSDLVQVEKEAKDGGYRIINIDKLSRLYQSSREKILLVDTRQEWENRAGHIAGSIHFPIETTWWARWRSKGKMKAFLGPEKEKTIVFY
jgi:predicted sulfurtransferase